MRILYNSVNIIIRGRGFWTPLLSNSSTAHQPQLLERFQQILLVSPQPFHPTSNVTEK